MFLPRVMPCLLLNNTSLVKTIKFGRRNYIGNPVNAIKIYNEKGVDEIILLDIGASKFSRIDYLTIEMIVDECFIPLTYGGGIFNIEQMRNLFYMGIEKVAIGNAALKNPEIIRRASQEFGSQSVVAILDIKKNFWSRHKIYDHCRNSIIKHDPQNLAKLYEDYGAGEIFLNFVDRDGTWSGYDIPYIRQITSAVNVPVIACGGAGNICDISDVIKKGGAAAAAIGSMAVYRNKGMGVLINFPSREKIVGVLNNEM